MKLKFYFFRMVFSVALLGGMGAFFAPALWSIFQSNPRLNTLILSLALAGVGYAFYQIYRLKEDSEILEDLKKGKWSTSSPGQSIFLDPILSCIAQKKANLDPSLAKGLAHSLADRLENERVFPRYLIGLLVFLGLLGTFWGLSQTIISIAHLIQSMPSDVNNSANFFNILKQSLQDPLTGMGTAFSSSLFGLGGSLVVGLLELQVGHAYSRFLNEADHYLTLCSYGKGTNTSASSAPLGFLQALLTRNVESMDHLTQLIEKSEKNEQRSAVLLDKLIQSLTLMSEQNKTHQSLMIKLAEGQIQSRDQLAKLPHGLDEESRKCLHNIEQLLGHSLQSQREDREELLKNLKDEMRLIARTIGSLGETERLVG